MDLPIVKPSTVNGTAAGGVTYWFWVNIYLVAHFQQGAGSQSLPTPFGESFKTSFVESTPIVASI